MKSNNQPRNCFFHLLLFLLLTMGLLGCDDPLVIPTVPPAIPPTAAIVETPPVLDMLPTPPNAPLEEDPLNNDFSDYQILSGSTKIIEPPALTTAQDAALAVVRIRGCDASSNCIDTNQGSGAIIHPNGIILTAWHVTVLDPRNQAQPKYYDHFLIEITDDVGSSPRPAYYARWIAYNTQDDLALLRIVGEYGQPPPDNWGQMAADLPWLPISNDERPANPDVWVMGYPPTVSTVDYRSYHYSGLEGSTIRIPDAIPKGFSGGPTVVQKEDSYEIVGVVSSRVQDVAFIRNVQQLENLIWRPQKQMWAENVQIAPTVIEGKLQSQLEITVHTLGYRATKFGLQPALLLISDDQGHKAQQRLQSENFVNIQQLSIPLDQNSRLLNQPLFVSIFRLAEGEVWRVKEWIMPEIVQPTATPSSTITDTPSPIATSLPAIPIPTVDVTLTEKASTATIALTPIPTTNTPLITPTPTPILPIDESNPALTATTKAIMVAESIAATLTAQPTATATWTPHLARTATAEAKMKSATATTESEEIAIAAAASLTAIAPTATATPEAGATYVNPVDNAIYIYVPAGEFIMGSNNEQLSYAGELCETYYGECESSWYEDEHPEHTVYLDSYWIMRTEVTNEQYNRFMQDKGYATQAYWDPVGWDWRIENDITQPKCWSDSKINSLSQPVVCVSWYEAQAYANWLSMRTELDFGLPTEAQWEKAARGTDGRRFPWGDQWDGSRVNYCDKNCTNSWADKKIDDGYQYTASVGNYSSGISPYGALDMAGNVWEWAADWYVNDYYKNALNKNPTGPADGTVRMLRGGAWYYHPFDLRVANRNGFTPVRRYLFVGFRLARHETVKEN